MTCYLEFVDSIHDFFVILTLIEVVDGFSNEASVLIDLLVNFL